jgi:hypothetical protein
MNNTVRVFFVGAIEAIAPETVEMLLSEDVLHYASGTLNPVMLQASGRV